MSLIPAGQTPPEGMNVLRGTVVVASFLGVSLQYVVRAAGGEELTVFAQNTEGSQPDALGVGREVQLCWDPRHTFAVARSEQ
jgi:spermidine/putrescine transport system ATP-binding protein